jgi:hypothetical protein
MGSCTRRIRHNGTARRGLIRRKDTCRPPKGSSEVGGLIERRCAAAVPSEGVNNSGGLHGAVHSIDRRPRLTPEGAKRGALLTCGETQELSFHRFEAGEVVCDSCSPQRAPATSRNPRCANDLAAPAPHK